MLGGGLSDVEAHTLGAAGDEDAMVLEPVEVFKSYSGG